MDAGFSPKIILDTLNHPSASFEGGLLTISTIVLGISTDNPFPHREIVFIVLNI